MFQRNRVEKSTTNPENLISKFVNRGTFTKNIKSSPREHCHDENVYEADNIMLDNVDPL